MGAYDDIIDLPHPTSARHPRMPMADRAAQFSPFAAISGHGAAIQETARLTDERIELTEEEKAVLDETLRRLVDTGEEAVFTWFQPDGKKNGGTYTSSVGRLKRLDKLQHIVVLENGAAIPMEDILGIEVAANECRT